MYAGEEAEPQPVRYSVHQTDYRWGTGPTVYTDGSWDGKEKAGAAAVRNDGLVFTAAVKGNNYTAEVLGQLLRLMMIDQRSSVIATDNKGAVCTANTSKPVLTEKDLVLRVRKLALEKS